MMSYNYEKCMKSDILDYIEENISRADYIDDRDALEQHLNDDCWISDSVTGNASGSYFCNAWEAKKAVTDNMSYCIESLREFCVEPESIAEHFLGEDWEYFDVTIRCYLLGQMVNEVLDELEVAGYFEESEADENNIVKAAREQLTA